MIFFPREVVLKMNKHMNKIIIGAIGIIVALCVIAILLIMNYEPTGTQIATIKLDGKVMREIDLSKVTAPESISIDNKRGGLNTIHIEPGQIGFTEANCPDQLCVSQGYISNSLLPAVCLPNGVVIEIQATDKPLELDAIVE